MFDSIRKFITEKLLAKAHLENIISEVEKDATPIGVGERLEEHKMVVTDNQTQEKETGLIELATEKILPGQTDTFIKAEKNIMGLGFFSASNKNTRNTKTKIVKSSSVINGKRTELVTEIVASGKYGLPGIAEQDTFFALLKLWSDISRQEKKIVNPVPFTYAQLLTTQNKNKSGFHYQEIARQLTNIKTTSIEGTLFLTETQEYVKDVFGLIDRVIFTGRKMNDGTIADKNYIWFSGWFLENIKNNYLIPIDYDAYKKLTNRIAKALVPILQIWLYASREEGKFEKLYNDVCEHIGITCYKKLSDIQRRFCPSLDELKKEGYLKKWELVQTSDKKNYKIIFYHGEKFYKDRVNQLTRKQKAIEPARPKIQETIDITPEPQEPASEPTQTQSQSVGETVPILATPQKSISTQPINTTPNAPQSPTTREKLENGSMLQPPAQDAFYSLIKHYGVTESKAYELVTTKLGQTQDQLSAFKYRFPPQANPPTNKAGLIIAAIEQAYELPESYLADKKKQQEEQKRQGLQKLREACTICKGKTQFFVKDKITGAIRVANCQHNQQTINKIRLAIQFENQTISTLEGEEIILPEPNQG